MTSINVGYLPCTAPLRWRAQRDLYHGPAELGYVHQVQPAVYRTASLAKRWLLGTRQASPA
jgi:hypothetical protein